MTYLIAQNDWQVSNYSRQRSTKIHASIYTTTTCIAHFLVQPNTNKLIWTTLQKNISEAREYFLQKKTESSTQHTYKNLELTAKTAARQEYSTSISEAQEYSNEKVERVSLTHEC